MDTHTDPNPSDDPNPGTHPADERAGDEQAGDEQAGKAQPTDSAQPPDQQGEPANEIERLKQELEKKHAEQQETMNRYLRVSADYQNFVKRAQQNVDSARQQQTRQILQSLLTVVDHFDHALQSIPEEQRTDENGIYKGLRMVYQELMNLLNRYGVERLDAQPGEEFDPERHEAMMRQPHDDIPEGRVVQQFQPGYTLEQQPLRPARVTVSAGPAA
jgi:molecular chaperone GrpE